MVRRWSSRGRGPASRASQNQVQLNRIPRDVVEIPVMKRSHRSSPLPGGWRKNKKKRTPLYELIKWVTVSIHQLPNGRSHPLLLKKMDEEKMVKKKGNWTRASRCRCGVIHHLNVSAASTRHWKVVAPTKEERPINYGIHQSRRTAERCRK